MWKKTCGIHFKMFQVYNALQSLQYTGEIRCCRINSKGYRTLLYVREFFENCLKLNADKIFNGFKMTRIVAALRSGEIQRLIKHASFKLQNGCTGNGKGHVR